MADFTLVIANKNYSSWSLRAWLVMKATGAAFEEIVVPLRESNTRSTIMRYSPSGKVPCLIHGKVTVWESLAIAEYLAELFPDAGLWPSNPAARAYARSIASEMHGGFIPLRRSLPMNIRGEHPGFALNDDTQADINRIESIWRDARDRFGKTGDGGPYLFGRFGIVDAMFAPVASRFATYPVSIGENARAYRDAILAHPFMVAWSAAAAEEPWMIPAFELDAQGQPQT
ncbi:MAG TPA: glutathione S-transferase family protein [Alphaproteobacteria bacterium]|jgi:glutathione S-transferase|nr:glutathione S-transferase family protein [Alphaproteobacteria bacterium]